MVGVELVSLLRSRDGGDSLDLMPSISNLLRDIHGIFEGDSTSADLDLLDEDDLPQNSDVVLILGQTVAAMNTFKEKYYGYRQSLGKHTWTTIEQ